VLPFAPTGVKRRAQLRRRMELWISVAGARPTHHARARLVAVAGAALILACSQSRPIRSRRLVRWWNLPGWVSLC